MKDLTLVVVNWEQQLVIELMLKSYVLHHYQGDMLNILLVDNGSIEGSKEWLVANGIPFISLMDNIGHEQAINYMYPLIKTKYALICDTDIEFLANVYDFYMPSLNDKIKLVGDYIDGDQLGEAKIKPRVGAWLFLFDIQAMREKGVNTFRTKGDWSYDVGSEMTEQIINNGFGIHHTPRLNDNPDSSEIGMQYETHNHFLRASWDLEKHGDRAAEVTKRRTLIQKRLLQYADIDLKNKFTNAI